MIIENSLVLLKTIWAVRLGWVAALISLRGGSWFVGLLGDVGDGLVRGCRGSRHKCLALLGGRVGRKCGAVEEIPG